MMMLVDLPYEAVGRAGWPSVQVGTQGLTTPDAAYAWCDLLHVCRFQDNLDDDFLEMRSTSGDEIRIYVPDPGERELLQEEILLRLIGVSRIDIPRNGEQVEILDDYGTAIAVGTVLARHLEYVYLDVGGEGIGGRRLDRIRRLPPDA